MELSIIAKLIIIKRLNGTAHDWSQNFQVVFVTETQPLSHFSAELLERCTTHISDQKSVPSSTIFFPINPSIILQMPNRDAKKRNKKFLFVQT